MCHHFLFQSFKNAKKIKSCKFSFFFFFYFLKISQILEKNPPHFFGDCLHLRLPHDSQHFLLLPPPLFPLPLPLLTLLLGGQFPFEALQHLMGLLDLFQVHFHRFPDFFEHFLSVFSFFF